MTDQALIVASVVMPVFQETPARLARAVESVLAQTEPRWELLLISDDGNDYSAQINELSHGDPRIRFLSTGQVAAGPSRGRNIALNEARGQTIVTLDSDDFFEPRKLEVMVPLALEHGMAIDNTRYGYENSASPLGNYLTGVPAGFKDPRFFMEIEWPLILVYARERFPAARYAENVWFAEDALLTFEMLLANEGAYFLDVPMHNYVVRPVSLSHGPDVGDLANRTYEGIIDELTQRSAPPLLIRAFQRKLMLNRNYQQWLSRGGGTFHDFVAEHDLPLDPDLALSERDSERRRAEASHA